MRQNRLHKISFLVSFCVLSVFFIISFLMYRSYNDFMKNSVRNECFYLKYAIETTGEKFLDCPLDENTTSRITLVDQAGTVLYDSFQPASELENHGNRPEFREALQDGSSEMTRFSQTLSEQTFYHAERLENGTVLRVAKTISSLFLFILIGFIVIVFLLFLFVTISLYYIKQKEVEMVRKEFSANVSHELKTPLMSISGYAEIIENGMVRSEDIPEFAGRIHHEAQRLTSLVNDIIQLSKLDEGAKNLPLEQVDLYEITRNAFRDLALPAAQKAIFLNLSGESAVLMGNQQILYEIFYNLVDNAIRYTPEGGHVKVEICPEPANVLWTVTDDGIGIAEEDQKHIFERFYRVDKSHSRATGGTGLGLSIVKHGAAFHKAKIHLVSKPGEGCSITLQFPAPQA